MPTVYTEVEVDVELADFDTKDLIEELQNRGDLPPEADQLADFDTKDLIEELQNRGDLPPEADHNAREIIEAIYHKRRLGRRDYEPELDQLIWLGLGKFV